MAALSAPLYLMPSSEPSQLQEIHQVPRWIIFLFPISASSTCGTMALQLSRNKSSHLPLLFPHLALPWHLRLFKVHATALEIYGREKCTYSIYCMFSVQWLDLLLQLGVSNKQTLNFYVVIVMFSCYVYTYVFICYVIVICYVNVMFCNVFFYFQFCHTALSFR